MHPRDDEASIDGPAPAWLDDWVHAVSPGPPSNWRRPGLALLFHLGCAGCVSRAVPWLKRAAAAAGDRVVVFGVHTAHGRDVLPRAAVAPQLERFVRHHARLPFPVALDLDGSWARCHGAEGTPHWLAWNEHGDLQRSVIGSQENALTRLGYLLEVWGVPLDGPPPDTN